MLFLSNQDIVHFGIWRFIFVLTILFGTSFLGMRDITLYIFSRPLTLGLDDIFFAVLFGILFSYRNWRKATKAVEVCERNQP
jgi:hypothetical protein